MHIITRKTLIQFWEKHAKGQNAFMRWFKIAPLLTVRNGREYNAAVKRLNVFLDEYGDKEKHALYGLLDTLGTLIHACEEEHYQIPDVTGVDVLRLLMEEHELTQSDLPEVGTQGVVLEILNGKRELNVRQVRALARRSKVSSAVFV